METLMVISEMLAVAIVVMMGLLVAYPFAVMIAQDLGGLSDSRPARFVQEGLGRSKRRSRATQPSGQADGEGGGRVDTARRWRASGSIDSRPVWPGRDTPAPPAVRDRRAMKRFKTCFLGTLHRAEDAEAEQLCVVMDLSAGGARVRLVEPMLPRRRLTLGLRDFGPFPARVVWHRADELGLKFEQGPGEVVTAMRGLLPSSAFPQPLGAASAPLH